MKVQRQLKIFIILAFSMHAEVYAVQSLASQPGITAAEEKNLPKVEARAAQDNDSAVKNRGAARIAPGRELVNMDFPELTDIRDIIEAVSLWTGKNVIVDRNVSGKVQIISPQKVTKEEAYQAFLSALNMLGLTTVETGKAIKILKVREAYKSNLKTYQGTQWAPRTDEVVTQVIPLTYVDAKQVQTTLSRIVSSQSMIAYEPTNTLIVTESGFKIRRILDILQLLDVETQQPKLEIVPIRHSDPKSVAEKVKQILQGARKGSKGTVSNYGDYKILADDRTGAVIVFGPPRTIDDVRDLIQKFDIPLDDPAAQDTIHVRPLDYADASKLASTLSSLTGGKKSSGRTPPTRSSLKSRRKTSDNGQVAVADLGDGVKITADPSSNSLLITGSRSAYESLNSIIRKLDRRRSQVYVEADILDVKMDGSFNFGSSVIMGVPGSGKQIMAWEGKKMGPLVLSEAVQATSNTASGTNLQAVTDTFAEDLTIGMLSGKSLEIPGLGKFTPGALISMLKRDQNTRVLSSPHVLTLNNEDASLTSGQKIFFETSDTSVATGVSSKKLQKEDVDLVLNIRPSISHSNYVTMKIELDQNELAGLTNGIPRMTKRKTKQTVTVKSGQTVVISGLMTDREVEEAKKIPLLGDLPVLGWLFRNTGKTHEKSNLLIFITSYAVHGPADLAAIYEAKLKRRDEFMKAVYGADDVSSSFYAQLPQFEDGQFRPTALDEKEAKIESQRREEELRSLGLGDTSEGSASGKGSYDFRENGGQSESIDDGFDQSTPVENSEEPPPPSGSSEAEEAS